MLCYNYTVELASLPFGLFFKRAWERGYSRVCLINSVMCVCMYAMSNICKWEHLAHSFISTVFSIALHSLLLPCPTGASVCCLGHLPLYWDCQRCWWTGAIFCGWSGAHCGSPQILWSWGSGECVCRYCQDSQRRGEPGCDHRPRSGTTPCQTHWYSK